jgi:nitrate reductase NapE component
MNKLRNMLWKNLGMTLDKKMFFLVGTVSISCMAASVFGILSMSTNNSLFRFLFVITIIPVVAISLGGSYRPLMWSLSNTSERKEIEQEVALEQLKRRVNEKHFGR